MRLIKSIRSKYFLCLLSVSILPVLFFGVYTDYNNNVFYNNQVESASRNEYTGWLRILTEIMKMCGI